MKHSSSNLSGADKLTLDNNTNDLQSGWDTWEPLPRRQSVIIMAGVMLAIFLASLDQTIVATAIHLLTLLAPSQCLLHRILL